LSSAHQGSADCVDCHVPWEGVADETCLHCHDFEDTETLKSQILFHEENKYCLRCHFEHLGLKADISRMDHTILNGNLLCTQCHLDRHSGLFGRECRDCHLISTWKVEGFRHPPDKGKNCYRCHEAPQSHYDEHFWVLIKKGHFPGEIKDIPLKECWQCHITHKWQHFRMAHPFKS
ncbi:MAG: hypothetical protein P8175_13295, partial [Deltaproteobacteria bacterium]